MEVVRVQVRRGEIRGAGSWVYVWRRASDGRVIYVGGTGLPPIVRTWLHLHGDDPEVARVRDRYDGAMQDALDVVAFRLPDDVARRDAKEDLIRQLADADMLAETYVGDPPQARNAGRADEEESVASPMVRHLIDLP